MEENGITKKGLNFFQKIRKRLYLLGMNIEKAGKYDNLPEYLKNDEDIVAAVVDVANYKINDVPIGIAEKLIKEKPDLIANFYDIQKQATILENNPEAVNFLSADNIYTIVYNEKIKSSREFIEALPEDVKFKMLTEVISYTDPLKREESIWNKNGKNEDRGFPSQLPLKYFSDESFLKMAMIDKENKSQRSTYHERLIEFNLKKLKPETQLKLIMFHNEYAEHISPEISEKFINNNPLLLDLLPTERKEEFLRENPNMFSKLPKTEQWKYKEILEGNIFAVNCFDIKKSPTPDDAKNELLSNDYTRIFNQNRLMYEEITNIRDDDYIWEMASFNPRFISVGGPAEYLNDLKAHLRANHIIKNMKKHSEEFEKNGEITEFLDGLETQNFNINNINNYKYNLKVINHLGKFLTNKDIMEKVSQKQILEYVQEYAKFELEEDNIFNKTQEKRENLNKKLADIIKEVYGEKSAKIIEDRPSIGIESIENLHVFHPEIIKEFGIGAVHATLSYNSNISSVFSELARKPEELEKFKLFDNMTQGMFKDTAIDLDKKLRAFVFSKNLMKDIDGKELTEVERENLEIAITEKLSKKEQNVMDFPKTLEELDTYKSRRDTIYDEAISKTTDLKKLKQLVSQRFFCLDFVSPYHTVSLKENSLADMCNFYNLKDFVNQEETLRSGEFTEEDLDSLELLDIIRKIDNPKILKEISETLSKKENIIHPNHYKELQEKVPLQYSKELVESLFDPEKAEEKVAKGDEGIAVRDAEDGVKIVTLQGTEFNAYITNPYLNNSKVKSVSQSDSLDLVTTWKSFENGISTFSGCLVSSDMPMSCVSRGQMGLGFKNINPSQIVGMGTTDIHVSHGTSEIEPITTEKATINYNYSNEQIRQSAERLYGNDDSYGDSMHKYNEIASARRVQELSEIKEDTFGGKTMPDYLYVYGKATDLHVKIAKEFGIKNIVEYDEEAYRGREVQKSLEKPKEITPRKETSFIKEIKSVARGEDDDAR